MTVIFTVKRLAFAWMSSWVANGGTLQSLKDSATAEVLADAHADDPAALRMIDEVRDNDPLYAEIHWQVLAGVHDGGAA